MCTDEINDARKAHLNNQADCYRDLENFETAIELIETALLEIESATEAANKQNARSLNLLELSTIFSY